MTDAFEPGLAEFPKITAGGPPLFISVVQHAADFAVNEQGTIAAAVTAVGAQPVDAEMPPQVSFDADRPFLFFLRDTDTGALLFAGRLTDAQAAGTSPELDARLGRIARRAPAAGGRPRERSVSSLRKSGVRVDWCSPCSHKRRSLRHFSSRRRLPTSELGGSF